jgi:DNA-binding GntR family transcriptional regulator
VSAELQRSARWQSEFEKAIIDAAQQSVIELFRESLIAPDYPHRIKLPADLAQKVYGLVEHDEVLAALRQQIDAMAAKTTTCGESFGMGS